MQQPRIQYTHRLVSELCAIERAKAALDSFPVEPGWEESQRLKARCGFIVDTLALEGIAADFDAVFDIMDGAPLEEKLDVTEAVLGLKEALDYIDRLIKVRKIEVSPAQVMELNRLCLHHLPDSDWHAGIFREIQTWVVDESRGEIAFTPPSPEKAPELIEGLTGWLRSEEAGKMHPVVLAGAAHLGVMAVSPFVFGNHRTACLLAQLILNSEGYQVRGWSQFTDHYAEDHSRYFRELAGTASLGGGEKGEGLAGWVEYFAEGIRDKYERLVKESFYPKREAVEVVAEPSRDEIPIGDISLNERQRLILELGRRYGAFHRRDVRAELEIAGRYSPKTTSRDLSALVNFGYLKKEGSKKGVRYTLLKPGQ